MVTRQYKLGQINDGYRTLLEGRNVRDCHPLYRRKPLTAI